MVAKSSAARGLVTFPPISLVEFWWCSMAHGWRETDRKVVPEASLGLPRGHIAQFWAIKCRRDPSGWDRIGRCDGIASDSDISPARSNGDAAPGYGVGEPSTLPPQRAPRQSHALVSEG
jgi:hypothetical protein